MPAAYKLLVEFDSLDELKSYISAPSAVTPTQETIDSDPDAPAMLKTPSKRGRKPKEETVATVSEEVIPYEQVQKATMDFVQAHGKEETKKVLSEFGAKIATEVKESDRRNYLGKLQFRSAELKNEELA